MSNDGTLSHEFKILHLSDAHIGNPIFPTNFDGIFKPLFEDLKKVSNAPPDLIVFSGDLVDGRTDQLSLEDQYQKAQDFLAKIFDCFGKKYGEIPLIIVPGNHDVVRPKSKAQQDFRDTLNPINIASMMREKDSFWTAIMERQKKWQSFIKTIPNQNWDWDYDLNIVTARINKGNTKIGVAGLNTCWSSHGDNEYGKIWLGNEQIEIALSKLSDCDLRIAVAHHPRSWLHIDENINIDRTIQSNFHVFFHGHEHSQWFVDTQNHLKVCAGACYGRKDKNCYSWLTVGLEGGPSTIRLRKFIDEAAGGWGPCYMPGKTKEDGTQELTFFSSKGKNSQEANNVSSIKSSFQKPIEATQRSLSKFLDTMQNAFFMRWEGLDLEISKEDPVVYWPVRLRKPTPIHAAQCFTAAGLQKHGCKIYLWIDDLGNADYKPERFSKRLQQWYLKAGGKKDQIEIRRFSEILNSDGKHIEPAWEMLQKWLGTMAYCTDRILKISKIWPSIEDNSKEGPAKVLSELSKRRPRRLMTPAMVWTCLNIMFGENANRPIITLGGYDEKLLWDAWRTCCEYPEMQVGHLYISKLAQMKSDTEQALHMAEEPLAWESKEDIAKEFKKAVIESNSALKWSEDSRMIPWCINNCVLLPNFISEKEEPFKILGAPILTLDDFVQVKSDDIHDTLIEAVNSWILSNK